MSTEPNIDLSTDLNVFEYALNNVKQPDYTAFGT